MICMNCTYIIIYTSQALHKRGGVGPSNVVNQIVDNTRTRSVAVV